MEALIDAAHQGKEVTVVVELLARFDEEANINWAERLEQAGAQVVYGVFGLKTHAKLALLLRREKDRSGKTRLQAYAHLGTGNYHGRTARLYTDFGLLTSRSDICADVNEVFLHITSLARAKRLRRLTLAPFTMHARLLDAIRRETRHARDGKPARIVAKMNALLEEGVIRALYAASQAGVTDRAHRARRVRVAPGARGPLGEHPRALDRRALPRAQPHLVFPQRRPRIGLADERRLDGPQPLPPDRGRVSRARSDCSRRGWSRKGCSRISRTTRTRGPWRPTAPTSGSPRRVGRGRSPRSSTCSTGWPSTSTRTPEGSAAHGSDPLAPRGSRARRAGPRSSPDRERHPARGADGGVARWPSAGDDARAGESRRPRAADGTRAEAQVPRRAGPRARRVGVGAAGRGRLAGRARAGAGRRPSTDAGRSRCAAARRARRPRGACASVRSGGCPIACGTAKPPSCSRSSSRPISFDRTRARQRPTVTSASCPLGRLAPSTCAHASHGAFCTTGPIRQ